MDLLEELKNVLAKLHSEGIEYALCGGLAMAIYAMPRATLDIDIMIELGTIFRPKRAVEELGFTLSGTLSVVSPEGLITLESFRSRGQDQDDIACLRSIIDEN
jgi:hypothetical protein